MENEMHEECGVFGVYNHPDAPSLAYFGLHALQHRGQEGAGIAVSNGSTVSCRKGHGLVTEVFSSDELEQLSGCNSIGHVRYSTSGGSELENVQPIVARSKIGCIAVAHNGQIVNADELRESLEEQGSIFHGSSDSEIILHLIQRAKGSLLEKIKSACCQLDGAFSVLILTEKSLYAIRDRNGLRPLSLARLGEGFCVSSETCAFDGVGASFLRDIAPGEIVKCSAHGMESCFYTARTEPRLCAMEYIYFSRPDSRIDGRSVHEMRKQTGRRLAEQDKGRLQADLVIGVPDSSLPAAIGYSEASGLPYELGLIKNRYVGRTFIKPNQAQRDLSVRMKLSADRAVIAGKRIVLVDDSVVRGTTSKRTIRLLKNAGAAEVHLRIASPRVLFPCFYGVDTSTREELISARLSEQELCRELEADSLHFLTSDDLKEIYGGEQFCFACFGGQYPTRLYSHTDSI